MFNNLFRKGQEREMEGGGKEREGKGWREGTRGDEREGSKRRCCDAIRGINWYSYKKAGEKEKESKQN
jgi:hypothetical protein